jgi:hypothetical protein
MAKRSSGSQRASIVAAAARAVSSGTPSATNWPQRSAWSIGRSAGAVLFAVADWHRQLNAVRHGGRTDLAWKPSGVPGFDGKLASTDGPRWIVQELTNGLALLEEGQAMHHCVASYATAAHAGRCAIFSVRRAGTDDTVGADDAATAGADDIDAAPERRLTVEVSLRDRRIEQARGPRNRPPDADEARLLKAWAAAAGLDVGRAL